LAERPACFLGYTVKPNVYGSLAARLCKVPAVNNISGLGTAFIANTWLTPVVEKLYRVGLAGAHRVFFQNEDDHALFRARKLAPAGRTQVLPGSGINLSTFSAQPSPARVCEDAPTFLLIARMVRDKGVLEYAAAARLLKARHPGWTFRIVGFLDVANRTAIDRATVETWVASGDVLFDGPSPDVRPHIAAADCIVLPSYREGTSRVLLEAAAMGRPLVATDVPGCREVVEDGINGFLCQARDVDSLAAAMERMGKLDPQERALMGAAGRAKVEREYDERIVIDAYLDAIRSAQPV
ncbi:MAG TPA: glycosyltransferase family 4 protein, partial [Sphingomonadaceae bacterium]|nr:glycosyltransferase family 4 protein [Sphingomonadaceae bacterium]